MIGWLRFRRRRRARALVQELEYMPRLSALPRNYDVVVFDWDEPHGRKRLGKLGQ